MERCTKLRDTRRPDHRLRDTVQPDRWPRDAMQPGELAAVVDSPRHRGDQRGGSTVGRAARRSGTVGEPALLQRRAAEKVPEQTQVSEDCHTRTINHCRKLLK